MMKDMNLTFPPDDIIRAVVDNVLEAQKLSKEAAIAAKEALKKPKKTSPRRSQKKVEEKEEEKSQSEKSKNDKYFRRVVSPKKNSK